MVLQEELKTLPFDAIWTKYLQQQNVESEWYPIIKEYENNTLGR